MTMIKDEWWTWLMMLIVLIIYLFLTMGCASDPQQPLAAYRDSMARIDRIYVQQAEIESLVYPYGYLDYNRNSLSK